MLLKSDLVLVDQLFLSYKIESVNIIVYGDENFLFKKIFC